MPKAYRVAASKITGRDLALLLHYLLPVVELRVQPNEFVLIPRVELTNEVRDLLLMHHFKETDLIGLPPA
jgi:hypothetical protein